ncbi:MAG: transketolase C-terminal domain-containing protein [Kiritimatiellia bacterium]
MSTKLALTGNDAGAEALKDVNPDVAAVFPITPQTELMHKFSSYVNDGVVDTELIPVESEHSAQSACFGAAASGARTITATSSQGLMLMSEICAITSSTRLPIVMPVVNRAISGPINIHCDHSDAMFLRDSGWLQLYSENVQEVYDNIIQAFRIAEHENVLLPVMVCLDGFILSHTMEGLEVLGRDEALKFVGDYHPAFSLLDTEHPISIGPLHLTDYYFECRRQMAEAMENSRSVVLDVGAEYGKLTGRSYGFFEKYMLEDAEVAIVALGSAGGTAKAAAQQARDKGVKAGVIKLRTFRPFPGEELAEVINEIGAAAVMDRAISYGLKGGPLFNEIRSFCGGSCKHLVSYVYGLGGRDINATEFESIFNNLAGMKKSGNTGETYRYICLRED